MTKNPQLSDQDKFFIKRLFKDNFKKHAPLYGKAIIAMVVIGLTSAASAWIMKDMVNNLVVLKDLWLVFEVAIAVGVIFLIKGFATYFQTIYLSRAGNSIIAEQQRKIYDQLVKQGVSFFQANGASDLLMRVTNNAQAARNIIDIIVTTYVRDLVSVVSLLAVMIWQNYWLTFIALVVGPTIYFTVRHILKRVKKLMAKELSSVTEIIKVVQETTTGIRVVKAFALERLMYDRMNKAVSDVERRANSIAKLQAATSPVMETLAGVAIAAVIAVSGVIVLKYNGTPGELMSFITALLLAYEPAKRLANSRIKIETGMVGVRMMFEILDHPITLIEEKGAQDLPKGKGNIKFDHASFAYIENHDVLKDITLDIPAGKMTALVGPSGSGKSTMINLIMRLYDPQKGKILIDGHDIKYATFKSLRERMSYVGQDTFLFQGTIKYNIGLGREGATDDEIFEAAKAANAHDFIIGLPNGYDTDVGENGGNLSGGQKQRVAIARAMLRNAEILILDEATSALDSETEVLIQEALNRLTKDRTTIVIAHRLSTIARADQIVVMRGGEIVEKGRQSELLKIDGGLYKRLHDLQFKNYDDTDIETLLQTKEPSEKASSKARKPSVKS